MRSKDDTVEQETSIHKILDSSYVKSSEIKYLLLEQDAPVTPITYRITNGRSLTGLSRILSDTLCRVTLHQFRTR